MLPVHLDPPVSRRIPLSLAIGATGGPTEVDLSTGAIVGSNPSAGVLRFTGDGTGAKNLSDATKTPLAYVWANSPIRPQDGVGFKGWLDEISVWGQFDEASGNGGGIVIGLTSDTSLTSWAGVAAVRTSSGNVERTARKVGVGDGGAATAARTGGLRLHCALTSTTGLAAMLGAFYGYTAATPSSTGSVFRVTTSLPDWTSTAALYVFAAAVQTTNATAQDLKSLSYQYRALRHPAAT